MGNFSIYCMWRVCVCVCAHACMFLHVPACACVCVCVCVCAPGLSSFLCGSGTAHWLAVRSVIMARPCTVTQVDTHTCTYCLSIDGHWGSWQSIQLCNDSNRLRYKLNHFHFKQQRALVFSMFLSSLMWWSMLVFQVGLAEDCSIFSFYQHRELSGIRIGGKCIKFKYWNLINQTW